MLLAKRNDAIRTLEELHAVLQGFRRSMTAPELFRLASRVRLSFKEWNEHLAFHPDDFCVSSLFQSRDFEINLIGWRSGQHSAVHDHRGTACAVIVLDGILTNRDYRVNSSGRPRETARLQLEPGQHLTRNDLQIHRCGNEQASGENLATLHLYSPPLRPLCERRHR